MHSSRYYWAKATRFIRNQRRRIRNVGRIGLVLFKLRRKAEHLTIKNRTYTESFMVFTQTEYYQSSHGGSILSNIDQCCSRKKKSKSAEDARVEADAGLDGIPSGSEDDDYLEHHEIRAEFERF